MDRLHFQVGVSPSSGKAISEKSTSLVLNMGKLFLLYTTCFCNASKPGQFEALFKENIMLKHVKVCKPSIYIIINNNTCAIYTAHLRILN